MLRTNTQNARFHKLIQQLGIDSETKADLVHQYTSGRTVSSSQMNTKEMDWLIGDLNNRIKNTGSVIERSRNASSGQSSAVRGQKTEDNLRKKIISLFREMNYHTEEGKADMTRIKATLKQKWGKDINDYTKEELSTIIAVLKRDWIPHFYKK